MKNKNRFFNTNNWKIWIEENLKNSRNEDGEDHWDLLFGVTIDSIWRTRNEWVFEQEKTPIINNLISIRCQVNWIVEAMKMKVVLNPKLCSVVIEEDGCWKPPVKGFWKLKCDGSMRNHGREVGCGGVLRDCYGRFIFGFSQKLDDCSVVEAELWSIYHSVSLAWGKGFTNLVVESDSFEVLKLIEDGDCSDESMKLLVDGIKNIGLNAIEVGWLKVDRAFNSCADILSKNSFKIRENHVIYDIVPDFIVSAVTVDAIGLAIPSMN